MLTKEYIEEWRTRLTKRYIQGDKLLQEANALCDLALQALSQPKGAIYEGQTAKEWHDAWDRENDAWQKMVQHHEQLEDAARNLCNVTAGEHYALFIAARERVRQIIEVKGSAPEQPKDVKRPEFWSEERLRDFEQNVIDADKLTPHIRALQAYIEQQPTAQGWLPEQIVLLLREYAAKHPIWTDRDDVKQDPYGVHKFLASLPQPPRSEVSNG